MATLSTLSDPISTTSQNSLYVGINIESILYGIELILYFKTIRILFGDREAHKTSDLIYALFSSTMVLLITIWIVTQALFGEKMWLLDSDFPGGPDAYWRENISIWYMDWAMTSIIILQLMVDGFMIYRCRIVWNSYRIIGIPIILWLSTLVLGVLVDWTNSTPRRKYLNGATFRLDLAYYTVSVFLNTFLTCMICYRIVQRGKRNQEDARSFFALFVESVLPYTLSGIAFLVSLSIGSPTSVAFACVYVLMMVISPQILILRVISGRAWHTDEFGRPDSKIRSIHGRASESWFDAIGAGVHLQSLSNVYLSDEHEKVILQV